MQINKNRKIILNVTYHVEDHNTCSSKNGRYVDFLSFNDIRLFIDNFEKKPHHISYHSSEKLFIVYIAYKHCSSREWDMYENEYAQLLISEMWDNERKANAEKRKELGYVSTFVGHPLPLCVLAGKLPKQIILDNLDYLSSGIVFGYFGASKRMIKHDEWIAELYETEDVIGKTAISQFLNHSHGRHFMDGIDSETTKEEFTSKLFKYMDYVPKSDRIILTEGLNL